MSKGRVLIITSDEELCLSLQRALIKADFRTETAASAIDGFAAAVESQPHCVICDLYLDDIEGTWVIAKLRSERSEIAMVPTLILGDAFDLDTALQGLRSGADAYLLKPITEKAIVHQVEALMRLVTRIRERRDSFLPPSSLGPLALRGDLEQMSLATVLMVIEMERRSGRLTITTGGDPEVRAAFTMAQGTFVESTLDGRPLELKRVLREVLGWQRGRFWFAPSTDSAEPNSRGTIGGILLNVMRELDEEAR
ncbi:MAG: response regulator [Myxococcales bacterium]|nr:response regulator [Myxococcales bacterium]